MFIHPKHLQDVILATPAGRCKGDLEPGNLVALSLDGMPRSRGHTQSTEVRMHLRVYEKRRDDVLAVFHAHPPAATGLAVAGVAFHVAE